MAFLSNKSNVHTLLKYSLQPSLSLFRSSPVQVTLTQSSNFRISVNLEATHLPDDF